MRKTSLVVSIQACLLLAMSASAMAQEATSATAAAAPSQDTAPTLDTVQVTGSRIPRAEIEGPAPVTVVTAAQIQAAGFTSVPEVLRSLTQNGGETQSQQSPTGAVTTPGAQQVDLRGLGPNHTLVLVNGRRIADFPLPLQGRSNFTDIGSIPLAMIDRIEVLTGSASAVYGSDAMAGVINFIMKKQADGITLDYRFGDTQHGGGESFNLAMTAGFSRGNFSSVLGIQYEDQQPLWAFDRRIQDSRADNPDPDDRLPRSIFERYDDDEGYNIDPGVATCDALHNYNRNTTEYADDPSLYGPYCGSREASAYGTILSGRESVNAYGSMEYVFNDKLAWFADLQLGYAKVELMDDTTNWEFQDANSYRDYAHVFNNQANDGTIEEWIRQFTPEEAGGFKNMMTRNTQKTFSIATGLRGSFGAGWDYEALYNHSQYDARVSFPRIVAGAANDLMLGPSLGYDDDGYAIRDADPERLFTGLSRAEYDSIAARSVFTPVARSDTASMTFNKADLFSMPAGAVGFAGIVEYGTQSYHLNPDPLALTPYYYGRRYGDGDGDRDHWGIGGEIRAPLFSTLNLSAAGRYDQYSYGDESPGKFTYNLGLEWRPVKSLLVRSSYGTGFRAPDLHYLFAGTDYFRTTETDYYNCRLEEGDDAPISDCRRSLRNSRVTDVRTGNPDLEYETSTSFTGGLVWSPSANFDVSVDYFDIRIDNQVQDLSRDRLLQEEADCRLGVRVDGSTVDPTSPTCIDSVARVRRDLDNDGVLLGVNFNPINISQQRSAGYDVAAHYLWPASFGNVRFNASYTYFSVQNSTQFEGDTRVDHLAPNSGYDIPRDKANLTISWDKGPWTASVHGQRLGRLPTSDSYDGVWESDSGASPWVEATYLYNATVGYTFGNGLRMTLAVDNLLDEMPPRDDTYTSYPYYDLSWFDSVGRSYYLSFNYKFGGTPR